MKRCVLRGSNTLERCQLAAICCQFLLRSLVIVLPYYAMNQSNMCKNTVFSSFMQMGLYVLQIALGRFARKMSKRAAIMVTIPNLVFLLQAQVALRVLHSLSV